MPNWCECALVVEDDGLTDSEAYMQKVRSLAASTGQVRDFFQHFVPMPSELDVTFDSDVPNEQKKQWEDKYGVSDPNEWGVKYWGTKWDASVDLADVNGEQVNFMAAWSPPMEFVLALSSLYPTATFTLAYAEGGNSFFGKEVVRGGVPLPLGYLGEDFWLPDAEDKHIKFLLKVKGDDEEKVNIVLAATGYAPLDDGDGDGHDRLTDECREHVERYGLGLGG